VHILEVDCDSVFVAQVAQGELPGHVVALQPLSEHLEELLLHSQVVVGDGKDGDPVFELNLGRVILGDVFLVFFWLLALRWDFNWTLGFGISKSGQEVI